MVKTADMSVPNLRLLRGQRSMFLSQTGILKKYSELKENLNPWHVHLKDHMALLRCGGHLAGMVWLPLAFQGRSAALLLCKGKSFYCNLRHWWQCSQSQGMKDEDFHSHQSSNYQHTYGRLQFRQHYPPPQLAADLMNWMCNQLWQGHLPQVTLLFKI